MNHLNKNDLENIRLKLVSGKCVDKDTIEMLVNMVEDHIDYRDGTSFDETTAVLLREVNDLEDEINDLEDKIYNLQRRLSSYEE